MAFVLKPWWENEGAKSSVEYSSSFNCGYCFRCARYKQQSTKTIWDLNKQNGGPGTTILELLEIKHDRAYLNVYSEESMCACVWYSVVNGPSSSGPNPKI